MWHRILAGCLLFPLLLSGCQPNPPLKADVFLRTQLRKDGVYRALLPNGDWMQCVLIEENARTSTYVDLETREIHQAPCPGDLGSIPLLHVFRVEANGTILWYDQLEERYRPYAEFLASQATATETPSSSAWRAPP